jgi:hypothetical protein
MDTTVLADDEALPPRRHKKAIRQPVARLSPLPGPYVRVPIQWICQPRRGKYLFRPEWRLFLYVLYRSHWGQVGVSITSAFRAEIGVSRNGAYRILERLERQGQMRVERLAGHALVAWPIVLNG